MTRIITLIAIAVLSAALPLRADYSVKSIKGQVQLSQNNRLLTLSPGMTLQPSDMIKLGAASELEIYDSTDAKIYTAKTQGLYSVTRLIFDARKKARSNSASIHGKLRMIKGKEPEGVVFVEKGKVTRSLAVYDPEAQNLRMDIDKLSRRLYTLLRDSLGTASGRPEAAVLTQRIDPDGLSFMVENTLSHPVYFNVFKISAADGSVTISELGQPVGCYAILPTQFLAREQSAGLNPAELHIMIMADFYFDIDELLGRLNSLLDSKAEITETDNITLYLLPL